MLRYMGCEAAPSASYTARMILFSRLYALKMCTLVPRRLQISK